MKLLDKIRDSFGHSRLTEEPPTAVFATRPDALYAPATGILVPLEEVKDDTISSGLLGKGYGLLPIGSTIYAPADGRINVVPVTKHAVGLLTKSGANVIIHVGLGTVGLEGKPFAMHVELNQEVKAGEPLLTFDAEAIRAAGCDDVITIVVASPELVDKLQLVGESNTLLNDHPLVKVGDLIMGIKR